MNRLRCSRPFMLKVKVGFTPTHPVKTESSPYQEGT